MPIRNSTMRDYVDPVTNTLGLLETGQPLPDDDPKTRNGGLNPARQQDSGQINMYMKLRQSGQISDTAWSRLIQRNPKAATLFSVIGPTPEAAAAKNRNEILSRYFSPEQEAKPYSSEDVGSGVGPLAIGTPIPGTARPAKADQQNAINAMLQAGDIEGAKQLLGVVSPRQGSRARPLQVQGINAQGKEVTFIIDPTTDEVIREIPLPTSRTAAGQVDLAARKAAAVAGVKKETDPAIAGAFGVLDILEELSGRILKNEGLTKRIVSAPGMTYEAMAQENPDIALYESISKGSLATVIRAMGERGALTEGDQQRALNLIPKVFPIPDRKDVASAKIGQIRKILQKAQGMEPPANTPQSAPQPKRLKYNPSTGRIE